MALDEDMAMRFYKIGDAVDLADQLVTILQSPELQRSMSEQNFAAGLQMTMATVVRNYLRWFELNRYKEAFAGRRREWLPAPSSRDGREAEAGQESRPHLEPVKADASSFDIAQI